MQKNSSLKLGYAPLININGTDSFSTQLQNIFDLQSDVIEYSPVLLEQLYHPLTTSDIKIFKGFKYRSFHCPAAGIRYSLDTPTNIISTILERAQTISAETLVFHPDIVDDFKWLETTFSGFQLGFENMDRNKSFGKTVSDLQQVFDKIPHAYWICDLNHVYSIDSDMKLADELHANLGDRLLHYHLSGYGGFHDCLSETHEDIILTKLHNHSVPIVHEGGAARTQKLLLQEDTYIREKLNA